jgi:NitT/TauT family transport system substrate-binding protein
MRQVILYVTTLTLALCITGCSKAKSEQSAQNAGQQKVKIRFAGGSASIPINLGVKKGFFAEQGIELELRKFNGGPAAITATAAGEIDVGTYGTPILIGAAKGIPIKIIGSPVSAGNNFVLVANPKFNNITELKGKIIGGCNPGGGSRQAFIAIARSKGLKLDDFQLIDPGGGSANAFAALQAGRLDATITGELLGAKAEIEGIGKVLARAADYFGRYQHSFFYATTKFIDKNPEAVRGFLAAYRKSVDYVKAHPEEAIQLGIKELELEEKPLRLVTEKDIPTWDGSGKVDLVGTNNAIEALKDLGDLDKSLQVTAEKLVDLRFLPK